MKAFPIAIDREDIIRMADKAGLTKGNGLIQISKFAELIAAAEREACAKLCFQMWNEWMDNESISELNRPDAEDCANAIRKRGQ